MSIYRKIWTNHFGPIPKDKTGRSYEIHHIDGNHKNNDITNLQCISIQEHYDIHYNQGDYGACFRIAKRLELSSEEKAELARQSVIRQKLKGKHCFSDPNWHKDNNPFKNPQWQSENAKRRFNKGTHHFQTDKSIKERQREKVSKIYEIIFPDGHIEIIKNLLRFCINHNLSIGMMYHVANGRYDSHKNFKCKRTQYE